MRVRTAGARAGMDGYCSASRGWDSSCWLAASVGAATDLRLLWPQHCYSLQASSCRKIVGNLPKKTIGRGGSSLMNQELQVHIGSSMLRKINRGNGRMRQSDLGCGLEGTYVLRGRGIRRVIVPLMLDSWLLSNGGSFLAAVHCGRKKMVDRLRDRQ